MRATAWFGCGAVVVLGAGAGANRSSAARDFSLRDSNGAEVGTVTLQPGGANTRVMVHVRGMTPGQHGTHLHQVGRCEAPAFTTAGGHWNPTNKQHGWSNPAGHHMGDMPNLTVEADGTGTMDFTVPAPFAAGPTSVFDADGTALVIHAAADDNKTDPSGNSGARVACAALVLPTL
jgi:superoxide dismutase, Cu-Zn family